MHSIHTLSVSFRFQSSTNWRACRLATVAAISTIGPAVSDASTAPPNMRKWWRRPPNWRWPFCAIDIRLSGECANQTRGFLLSGRIDQSCAIERERCWDGRLALDSATSSSSSTFSWHHHALINIAGLLRNVQFPLSHSTPINSHSTQAHTLSNTHVSRNYFANSHSASVGAFDANTSISQRTERAVVVGKKKCPNNYEYIIGWSSVAVQNIDARWPARYSPHTKPDARTNIPRMTINYLRASLCGGRMPKVAIVVSVCRNICGGFMRTRVSVRVCVCVLSGIPFKFRCTVPCVHSCTYLSGSLRAVARRPNQHRRGTIGRPTGTLIYRM